MKATLISRRILALAATLLVGAPALGLDTISEIPGDNSKSAGFPPSAIAQTTFMRTDNLFNCHLANTTINCTLDKSGATAYRVYDINGNLAKDSRGKDVKGTISGTAFSITGGLPKLGWYEVHLMGPNRDSVWGNSYGVSYLAVIDTDSVLGNILPYTDSSWVYPNDIEFNGFSPALHKMFDLGPIRFPIDSRSVSTAQQYANWIVQNLTYDATYGWTSLAVDSARPARQHLSSFYTYDYGAIGTQDAAVTAAVTILGTLVAHGGTNEPNGTGAQIYTLYQAFFNAAKAGNSSAQVVGPNIVQSNGNFLQTAIDFLTLTPRVVDAWGFHPYNSWVGDSQSVGATTTAKIKAATTTLGISSMKKWCTEMGMVGFTSGGGVSLWRRHVRTMLNLILQMEYAGIPKERNNLFYDKSHGFWQFPSFLVTENNFFTGGLLTPGVVAYRTLSEQLRGTNPQATKLDFGSANPYLEAYQYSKSDGTYVTAMMTTGSQSLPVTISGATSAVDCWGNSISLSSNYGLGDLAIYIKSAAPLTISDVGNGLISATPIEQSAVATPGSGMSPFNIENINNGAIDNIFDDNHQNPYFDGYPVKQPNGDIALWTSSAKQVVTLTWSGPQTIKRFGLHFARPYQSECCPTALNVEAYISGSWTTIYSYSNPSAFAQGVVATVDGSAVRSFYNAENVMYKNLSSAISASAIRVTCTAITTGEAPDDFTNQHAQFVEGSPPKMCLSEFFVYSN